MTAQLELDKILPPEYVAALLKAIGEHTSRGADRVNLVHDSMAVGQLLTPEEAKDQLTRRLASHWAAHPEFLKQIQDSFEETPKKW